MNKNKLLTVIRVISKIIGIILMIVGGLTFIVGLIFRLIMGPVEPPQTDNVMMIGIGAILLLFQSIPFLMIFVGLIIGIIGILNIVISGVIDNYNYYEIEKQKRKSYQLIIAMIIYGIILFPSFLLMIAGIFSSETILEYIYLISYLLIYNAPYILLFVLLVKARNQIMSFSLDN
ncbi:MAG: hypothetical protein J6K18_03435 [Bacilli bacterium]|nr:hypothetical protein [Bacilli bacterium]